MFNPTQKESRKLSSLEHAEFEDCIARFEKMWHENKKPAIQDFLPEDPVLKELVQSELQAIEAEFQNGLHSTQLTNVEQLAANSVSSIADPKEAHLSVHFQSSFESPTQSFSGGLGDVWVVDEPALGRSVVVKQLQKRWQNHKRAQQAFLQEVRITSLLEHPGVAPVHAVGQTSDGRPCYSMRYIHGETFEKAIQKFHSQRNRCGHELRNLLGHFVTVCQTIAYAHSRGVIHRDLKPSNVMIGPYGQTMVIDWGLAKQVEHGTTSLHIQRQRDNSTKRRTTSGSDTTCIDEGGVGQGSTQLEVDFEQIQTSLGDIVGTPAFMSPEQASGNVSEISTATDIFGLGSILYCILYGTPPYLEANAEKSIERARCRDIRFSSSLAGSRVSKALVAICCKATEENPKNRYTEAAQLASEIQNWLANEPIIALPPTLSERIGRFAKRRRTLAVTAVVAMLGLCVTAGVASVWIQHEQSKKRLAEQTAHVEAQAASDISNYISKIFRTVDPVRFDDPGFVGQESFDSKQTLRNILDSGFELIGKHFDDHPELKAELFLSLGNSYRALASFERAESLLAQSFEIRKRLKGDDALETLESKYQLARLASDSGYYQSAEQQLRDVIKRAEKLIPPAPMLVADSKYHLAWLKFYQPLGLENPQFNRQSVLEGIQLFNDVIEIREEHLPKNDRSIGLAKAGLAAAMICLPEHEVPAGLTAAGAMEIFRNSGQDNLLGNFLLTYQRAERLRIEDKSQEAEQLYNQLGQTIENHLGKQHPVFIIHRWNMVGHYRKFGQLKEAENTVDEIRDSVKHLTGLRSLPRNVDCLVQYAEELYKVNRSKARVVATEALAYAHERPVGNENSTNRLEQLLRKLDEMGDRNQYQEKSLIQSTNELR